LGKSQSQGARVFASCLHQAHVEKAMQSRMISPDRLLEPIPEVEIQEQGTGRVTRRSMMRIMARRTKAATVLA
jgi:hypothetical protein